MEFQSHEYGDDGTSAYASIPMSGTDILADIRQRNAQRQPIELGTVHDFSASRPDPHLEFDTALALVIGTAANDAYARRKLLSALEGALIELRKTKARTAPLSPDFRTLEVTVYDNWPSGSKKKSFPHRYALSIRAWSGDGIDFISDAPDFRGNVTLMDAEALRQKAEVIRSPKKCITPLSDAYWSMIDDDVATLMAEQSFLGGMLISKPHGEGTIYHDQQVVVLDPVGLEAQATDMAMILMVGGELRPITDWSATDAGGKSFPAIHDKTGAVKARVVMQARIASTRRMAGWSTNLPTA